MIRRVRTVAAAAVLAALASVVSACTSSSPTPDPASTVTTTSTDLVDLKVYDILDAAHQAMLDAGSYHVHGRLWMHSNPPVMGTIDADYAGDESRCTWTLETTPAEVAEAMVIGGFTYVKAPAAYWLTTKPLPFAEWAQTLDERWVRFPTGNLGGIEHRLFPDFPYMVLEAAMNQKQQTSVDGMPVLSLTGVGGQMLIALQGPPYPLRAVGKDTASGVLFTDYGKPIVIEAPEDFANLADLV